MLQDDDDDNDGVPDILVRSHSPLRCLLYAYSYEHMRNIVQLCNS